MSSKKTSAIALSKQTPAEWIQALEVKIKEMETLEEGKVRAKGTLNGLNIDSTTNVGEIIKAHSYITRKANAYNESAKALKVKTFPVFKEENYTSEEWVSAFEYRIFLIENEKQLTKLKEFKKRAQDLMTDEDKRNSLAQDMGLFLSEL